MTHARRIVGGLLLFFGGATSCLAQPSGAGDQSADACPATLTNVRAKCGCEPREEAVFNSLAQTKLNSDNLRSRLTHCFNLNGQLNVDRVKLKGGVGLDGCLTRLEEQYPEYRTVLADLVRATKDVPPRKLDAWLTCYELALGAKSTPPPPPPPPSKGTRAPGPRPSAPTASRPSSAGATAPAPAPGIEQRVEAEGQGRVSTGEVEASHDGRSGSTTVRQVIKASGQGVITTGPIKAHVGP